MYSQFSLREAGRRHNVIIILRHILIPILTLTLGYLSPRALPGTSLRPLLCPASLLGLICWDREEYLHGHLCHFCHTHHRGKGLHGVRFSSSIRTSPSSYFLSTLTQVLVRVYPCLQKECIGAHPSQSLPPRPLWFFVSVVYHKDHTNHHKMTKSELFHVPQP